MQSNDLEKRQRLLNDFIDDPFAVVPGHCACGAKLNDVYKKHGRVSGDEMECDCGQFYDLQLV